jgi:hypothetical protein
MNRGRTALVASVVAVCLASSPAQFAAPATGIPDRISNDEFWRLGQALSEPAGFFNSDNLVSNEETYQHVLPDLVRTVPPGGVYIGVGPDQNFTYVAEVQPAMAFIPDVRRGNLQLHLMYKALFGLSSDRLQFLSRLFSRAVPSGLAATASALELMEAFAAAPPDAGLYEVNRTAVREYLERHRGAPLDDRDRAGVAFVQHSFYVGGPGLTFVSNAGFRRSTYPAYAALQAATDSRGVERGYLSTDARYQRVKSLQDRNLVVPVVGNFSGPLALAAIGTWIREQGGVVTAFYTSNVEQYLFQDGTWERFRRNVSSMPIDSTSTFIRSCFNSCASPTGSRSVTLLDSIVGLLESAATGRIQGYWDLLTHSRSASH